tara:strand:+ start:339 stop:617 length:279 start_codon:yes stop_codon:yes gene_type:complete
MSVVKKKKEKKKVDITSLDTNVYEKPHKGTRPTIFAEGGSSKKHHKIVIGGGFNIPVSKKVTISPSIGFISEKSKYHKTKGTGGKIGITFKI